MEKKTTKKPAKKADVKKSAPKKTVKKKGQEPVSKVSPVDVEEYEVFNIDSAFDMKIPRSIYASLFWMYFKMYIKSFFKK